MSRTRFRVRLARPVFQFVIVEVEADDKREAAAKALGHAGRIPEEEWSGAFDAGSYFCDAHVTEIEESGADDEADAAVYGYTVDRYTKYLLLKADTFSGEGAILFQPWLKEVSPSVAADLFAEWRGDLEKAERGGASKEVELMEKGAQDAGRKPAKVIPLRRPRKGK